MSKTGSSVSEYRHTASGVAVTSLILEIFRFNGRLLAKGDQLVQGLGLSSARWQVLGTMALSPEPQTVAWLSRARGLKRQGVQRIVNEMEAEGFVEYLSNPNHARARLVALTAHGRKVTEAAHRLQVPWANRLAQAHDAQTLTAATEIITALCDNLDRT